MFLKRLLVVVLAAGLSAAQERRTRPCSSADLDGIFALVDFQEFPAGALAHAADLAPYRFIAFLPPSAWARMAFNMMPGSPNAVMIRLNPQIKGSSFTLQADGQIILNRGQGVQFAGTCSVSLQTGDGFRENDLILSGSYTGVQSQVHELFRHWSGGPVPRAVSTFDPAPSAAARDAQPAAESDLVRPSMPDKPIPLDVKIVNGSGPNGPNTQVSIVVKNTSNAPLSAFMLVFRGMQTAQRWKDTIIDACLDHRGAWQPGQQWTKYIGIPIQVGNIDIFLGAAIFSDGSTWGEAHRLTKLKVHRGNCQWPGS